MDIQIRSAEGIDCAQLQGRLDSVSAPVLDLQLSALVDSRSPPRCLLDMQQLSYVSSAGLRVLLLLARRVQSRQGQLLLFGLTANVREVFEISGFSRLLNVRDDEASARAALGPSPAA